MRKIRVCETLIRPQLVAYPSKTRADKLHTVVAATIWNDSFCTCEGWQFSKETPPTCVHVKTEAAKRCTWHVPLTEATAGILVCPNCGADTMSFDPAPEFD